MRGSIAAALVAAAVAAGWSGESLAHSGGVGGGDCSGCHGNGNQDITVFTTPSSISPGQQVTVTIRFSSPTGNVAGLYAIPDTGSIQTLAGEGLAEVNGGITHTSPKSLSGGQVDFRFEWTAPNQPGAVRFEVSSVVGNGNGNSGGDGAVEGDFDFVYGCDPQQYFRDFDGDSYGRDTHPLVHCAGAPPGGYGLTGDDCDDNRDTVYPGATEYCNLRDDDCDGEIDEDALPVEQYPDGDGDGYYGLAELETGETFLGCVPTEGWAAEPGDCAPLDPAIHPGAEEICNLYDDNCDGKVDEGVRPRCGEGWCRREAITCEPSSCTPGEPREFEQCNLLDDDCDGLVDEEADCPVGEVCVVGVCQVGDGGSEETGGAASTDTAGSEGDSTGSGSSTGTSGGPAAAGGGGGKGCSMAGDTGREHAWLMLLVLITWLRPRGRSH